ncbi:MAG: CDP-alcohol phosphatidyltransferase family protein [Candidatus Aenigmarchaeota archaeon]|nr:CDP-alcohol phosphatidyltransferase family protein [Candidatus Aenigmarchaeota archaeon]NIP40074.1 CDP-alcohol phosphatidyltransferase family protein [Candidatus Aenigmarchaeota archaeon]NIQ18151.1 CDP-alcohol phosphatidyltransferase family protein [Candidatus Aenigmarchaeota archaeon]NIS72908.1 CDP-alcohol phosphatidyltransferase family protein [Candidatus Aenigmarchaeota archaeon]
MTFYAKREKLGGLSSRIGKTFAKLGLSPNQWTLLTLIPTIVSFYFLVKRDFLLAALFFLLSSFMDWIDGSVARVTGKTTNFGAYLDSMMDRYVEFIIILGIYFAGIPSFYLPAEFWIILYLFGSLMTTYAKAAAKEKDLVKKEIKGGLLERAERLILLFFGMLLAFFGRIYLTYIIVILAILTNLTAFQRMRIAIKK